MFEKIRLSSAALIAVLSVSGAVVVAQDQQPVTTGTPQIQKQKRGDGIGAAAKSVTCEAKGTAAVCAGSI